MQEVAHRTVPARLRPWLALVAVAAVCSAILVAGDPTARALRYDRNALLDGQLWRALTGHLVHVSWLDLGFELAVATVVVALFRRHLGWRALLLCAIGASAGLFLFGLRVHRYAGLSAVLHGLVVYGALAAWRRDRLAGWLVIVGLVVTKLVVEVATGSSFTAADSHDVTLADVSGAVSGALAFVLLYRPDRRAA